MKLKHLLLLMSLLVACATHQEQVIDKNQPRFEAQESNKLFFRNMREPYYYKEAMKSARMEIFRLSERDTASQYPIIHVKIVQHLANAKVYAMIEPNAYFNTMEEIIVSWSDSTQTGTYNYSLPARQEAHFQFATELYTSIQQGHQLYLIQTDSAKVPLFTESTHREAFRKTMVDFYRLVDLL